MIFLMLRPLFKLYPVICSRFHVIKEHRVCFKFYAVNKRCLICETLIGFILGNTLQGAQAFIMGSYIMDCNINSGHLPVLSEMYQPIKYDACKLKGLRIQVAKICHITSLKKTPRFQDISVIHILNLCRDKVNGNCFEPQGT